jgi:putative ATP-dependent endonuclease of the OLD family
MLLKTAEIRNFRCLSSVDLDLDPTTILIGENNSGKTSFLDALRICLSRSITRRGAGLEDYDYHLSSPSKHPQEAGELSITLDFIVNDDTPADVIQAIGDLIVFDSAAKRHAILQLKSVFDKSVRDFVSDWNFLDCSRNPLGAKAKRPQQLVTFLQYTPIFYLTALRDAAREFNSRSTFWAPFIRYPGMADNMRDKLQQELTALNHEVLKAHTSLQKVKAHIGKVQGIVSSGKAGIVDIDALPGRITDLLSRTQINITAVTGAKLPLEYHGSGTQSLAVIFLFEAFLSTMLVEQYHQLSEPILTLEEPEAHLHPCATRSLCKALEAVPGQKIIATHSGDLLACVPLSSVRRFYRKDGFVRVGSLAANTLSPEDLRKIEFHLQSSRGELLFARCWLLGEGESEYWVFSQAARIIGYDTDHLGIRVVNTRHSGVEILVKTANDFGIAWYFVGDGDQQGEHDKRTCEEYLGGRDASKHLHLLKYGNIDILLCAEGFGHIYEAHVSEQKKNMVTARQGTQAYWEQVVNAQPNREKPARIREVMTEMNQRGKSAVPKELVKIIQSAVALSEGK